MLREGFNPRRGSTSPGKLSFLFLDGFPPRGNITQTIIVVLPYISLLYPPSPFGSGRQLKLSKLRRWPVPVSHEGHHQDVLALENRFRAGQAAAVQTDEISLLLLRPDGKHLASALLVEPHVRIPVVVAYAPRLMSSDDTNHLIFIFLKKKKNNSQERKGKNTFPRLLQAKKLKVPLLMGFQSQTLKRDTSSLTPARSSSNTTPARAPTHSNRNAHLASAKKPSSTPEFALYNAREGFG